MCERELHMGGSVSSTSSESGTQHTDPMRQQGLECFPSFDPDPPLRTTIFLRGGPAATPAHSSSHPRHALVDPGIAWAESMEIAPHHGAPLPPPAGAVVCRRCSTTLQDALAVEQMGQCPLLSRHC